MNAASSYTEQRRTAKNIREVVMEARVIANYGDPGLDEDYHFDILSRYVVAMIESCQRVPTADKYAQMIVLVKRPESLWISTASMPDGNPANQQRVDAAGNLNKGIAASYATNGISRIFPAYAFGEVIKIRKLSGPLPLSNIFFSSAFSEWDAPKRTYGSWHTDGSTLSYFSSNDAQGQLQNKTIIPIAGGPGYYSGILYKMQYEAFALSLLQAQRAIADAVTTIFNGTWNGNEAVYSANGGYVFKSSDFLSLSYLAYEDVNVGQKARATPNACLPLIVAAPSSFPIPTVRALGSIGYNPSYTTIVRS
jgi:hypothetical protein